MLSSVFLSGAVGEFDNRNSNIRYVALERIIPDETGRYSVQNVPVMCRNSYSDLLKAKKGQMIVLKGRLDVVPEIGLVIMEELDEIYTASKK